MRGLFASAQVSMVLALVRGLPACGDVDDVQLPLVPSSRASTEAPTFMPVSAPRTVVSVDVGAGAAGSCPIEYSSLLPPDYDRADLRTGNGSRLVDGDGALVDCQVLRRQGLADPPELRDVFDVELVLSHDALPRLALISSVRLGEANVAQLDVLTPDGVQVEAECDSNVFDVHAGAAWLELSRCSVRSGSAARDCSVQVTAIVESCRH